DRYEELGELLSDPEVISDSQRFMKLSKEMGNIRETVEKYNHYKEVTSQIEENDELLHEQLDDEMNAMVKDDLKHLNAEKDQLEHEI
ncbi:PCRF domain-containing protein, partial [Xylella fastidiosa]|uniref:PCRF domain-containing protein n=1 Tax=Xylella fastidiosa TaxID=2371 RepID=UPI0012AD8E87